MRRLAILPSDPAAHSLEAMAEQLDDEATRLEGVPAAGERGVSQLYTQRPELNGRTAYVVSLGQGLDFPTRTRAGDAFDRLKESLPGSRLVAISVNVALRAMRPKLGPTNRSSGDRLPGNSPKLIR